MIQMLKKPKMLKQNGKMILATLPCIKAISPQVGDFKNFGVPRVNVVRCALAEQRGINDWQRSAIFQTYTKCGDKTCKVIIDSGSCINAMSSSVVSRLGLKLTPHPNPYKVFWVGYLLHSHKRKMCCPTSIPYLQG